MTGIGTTGPESDPKPGSEAGGTGQGPNVRPNQVKDTEEVMDELFSGAMEIFRRVKDDVVAASREARKRSEPQMREAEEMLRDVLSTTGGILDNAGSILSAAFQPEAARKALESSAHIWSLVSGGVAADGYVRRPDGTAISAKFDGFEGLSVNVGGERMTVTIGKSAGKEYLLGLRNPSDLTSSVVMGDEGWEDIQAYGRILVGKRGEGRYLINPVTGGSASGKPL